MIRLKRAYEEYNRDDGYRILVDRLWPRGISKEEAKIDMWLKDIAPGDSLRKWFGHDPKRWAEFRRKYLKELEAGKGSLEEIKRLEKEKNIVTLVYSAKDESRNNAVVLKEFLEGK